MRHIFFKLHPGLPQWMWLLCKHILGNCHHETSKEEPFHQTTPVIAHKKRIILKSHHRHHRFLKDWRKKNMCALKHWNVEGDHFLPHLSLLFHYFFVHKLLLLGIMWIDGKFNFLWIFLFLNCTNFLSNAPNILIPFLSSPPQ